MDNLITHPAVGLRVVVHGSCGVAWGSRPRVEVGGGTSRGLRLRGD